nr:cell adhesion molecule 3 [Drosophila virilis]
MLILVLTFYNNLSYLSPCDNAHGLLNLQGIRYVHLYTPLSVWPPTQSPLSLCLLLFTELAAGLRNVNVHIPAAVKRGDNALLICNYDIENDTLYAVKWYRGRREFYRYTPKENPAWKIFTKTNEIDVETTQSNASHVLLRNVPTSISGKFACEVSADAPTFDTSIVTADMEVVELPTQRPIITGIHSRYRLGDIINGNCSSDYSKPAANLTWWINDIQVPPNYLRTYDIQKHLAEHLESAVLELNFVVTTHHFIKGRLKLKCSARIHNIYAQESEKLIEEDRPRILASGRSPDMNMYPFDQPGDADEHNDLQLPYKNAASRRCALDLQQQPTGFLLMGLLHLAWTAVQLSRTGRRSQDPSSCSSLQSQLMTLGKELR